MTTTALASRAEHLRPVLDRLTSSLLSELRDHPDDLAVWLTVLADVRLSPGERTALTWLARRMWPQCDWPYVSGTEVVARCDSGLAEAVAEAGTALVILDQGDGRIGVDRG